MGGTIMRIFIVALICIVGSLSLTAQTLPAYVSSQSLIGWWPLDKNAADSSGNELDGEVFGATRTVGRAGVPDTAYDFGVTGITLGARHHEIAIPYDALLNTQNLTVAVWVKPRSLFWQGNPAQKSTLIARMQGGDQQPSGEAWSIDYNFTSVTVTISDSTNTQAVAIDNNRLLVNDWNHVAFTYDGVTLRVYINGILRAVTATTLALNTRSASGISVGELASSTGYWNHVNGAIDEIGMWGRALTPAEITNLVTGCAVAVTRQPSNVRATIGATATFVCASSVPDVTYQWQRVTQQGAVAVAEGGQFTGTTTNTLRVSDLTMDNDGAQYRCVIARGTCIDSTRAVTLNVCGAITRQPDAQKVRIGESASFSCESSDNRAGYQWQIGRGSAYENLQQADATAPTITLAALTMANTATSYRCVVTSGTCVDTSRAATLDVCGEVTTQPGDVSARTGDTVTLTVGSTDTTATYQWEVSFGEGFWLPATVRPFRGGTTSTLTHDSVTVSDEGVLYRCIVRSGECVDTIAVVRLAVCGRVTAQPESVYGAEAKAITFTTASTDPRALFQWQIGTGQGFENLPADIRYKGARTATLTISPVIRADHESRYRCVVISSLCADTTEVAELYVCGERPLPPTTQIVKVNTVARFITGTTDATATYQWQMNTGTGFRSISDNATFTGTTNDTLEIKTPSTEFNGAQFRCRITSNVCVFASATASLYVCGEITRQPENQRVPLRNDARFSVGVSDRTATYQWQISTGAAFVDLQDGRRYRGTTTAELLIVSARLDDDNTQYRCMVKTGECREETRIAVLRVGETSVEDEMQGFSIAPNPVSDDVVVRVPDTMVGATYTLTSSLGTVVRSGQIDASQMRIDMQDLVSGAYIMHINGVRSATAMIVKQ